MSSFFRPKERRTASLTIRITPALERNLKLLAELWSVASQAHSEDAELKVSENDAAFRLLEESCVAAISEMLGADTKWPETDAEMDRVKATIRRRFAAK